MASALTVDSLLNPVLEAVDDGVPVFILDAALDVGGAYNVTIDQHQWAQTGLTWMFDKIGGEGQIAYFDIDPVNRHSDTINEVLSNYPGITVVDYRDNGDYDPNMIKPETVDFMKTYPDLKAVWSNYNMTQAILGMDEESSMPQEQWPLVLCEANRDGLETWMRMREKYPDFDCIALVNPPGIAYDATYAAYYLSSGMRINQEVLGNGTYGNTIFVDIPVITGDDVQEWLDRAAAENMDLVDALMTPDEIKSSWLLD